uniref:HD/PDEase domain-containing protein n=1 Tax=Oryza rufipogon TaxID=4529 RepID=A0A0E0R0L0_ORYRU
MAAAAVRAAEELAEREMAGRDASHDAAHALRVRDLALSLAAELGLSSSPDRLLIVEIAALLHDIEVELEQGQREEIVAIIKGMGFKNEVSKKSVVEPTLEFAIVQDADRLDAIGIARCFTYGGSKKNTLHDPKILPRDNLSKEKYMSKDEKQTSINHFHEKLFKLKDMMKTERKGTSSWRTLWLNSMKSGVAELEVDQPGYGLLGSAGSSTSVTLNLNIYSLALQ